jgi:nucleoside-diphosphate-sugar epimerase
MSGAGREAVVTGGSGFVGRHLVRHLAATGWRVRSLDLAPPSEPLPQGAEWERADVLEADGWDGLLAGTDTVFHLASAHLQVGAPPAWFRKVNVDGAVAVVRACARAGVRRLVHAGTVGVYGHVSRPPADEDAPKSPENEYERTKLRGEEAVLAAAAETGLGIIVLRPSWVYGPGCPRTAKLLRSVREGRFAFVGDGSNLRHPIFIGDAVRAFALAADAPDSALGRPWLVVGPRSVTVRDLVEACAHVQEVPVPRRRLPRSLVVAGAAGTELAYRLLGKEPPVSRRSLAFFDHDNAFDGSAAERELGFRARVELEEGLRRTLETDPSTSATAARSV